MRTPITVTGNLAGDPELRYFPDGRPVVNFSLADNNGYRNAAGEYIEQDPVFWPVQVTREMAENVAESLKKGDAVTVRGQLVANNWTPAPSAEDPEPKKRYGTPRLEADDVAVSLRRARVKIAKVMREEPNGEASAGAGSGRRAAGADSGLHTSTTGSFATAGAGGNPF